MKKWIAVLLVVVVYDKWAYIDAWLNPPPEFVQQHFGTVVMYSTDWCGYCEKTRQLFKSRDIDYIEYDIEKSEQAKQQFDLLGGRGVPVVLYKGEVVRGYNRRAITNLVL